MAQFFDAGEMASGEVGTGATGLNEMRQGRFAPTTSRTSAPNHASAASADNARGLAHYRGVPAFGVLQHAAEQLPDRHAVCYGDVVWTYQELNRDAIRCAAMLQRIGVKPGDRVGILLPNVPEFIIAANAIWRAGGVAVAISPLMVSEEVEKLVDRTDCQFVICLDLLSHVLDECQLQKTLLVSIREHLPAHKQLGYFWMRHRRTGHWTMPASDRCGWFWEEIAATETGWQPISIKPATDPAYILPTGGTTGSAKAVTLSHQNMVANAWQQYMWVERSFGKETMLGVLPFFHSYGVSATVMGGAMMGATLALHHRFNTRQVIRLIEQSRPTVFHAVPAMLVAMNERLRSHPAKLDSLRWVISGGASLEESVGREFSQHSGALVVEGFGLSESSPVTHVGDLFAEARFGVIGLPLPETECRIVDANDGTEILPQGEVGELIVRGPQIMLGYWNDEAATRQSIQDGWLHTGDLAMRHPDGNYTIVGRKKDLIITSGFNVYPSEVEEVLRQCDDVLDAAVIAHPDAQRGEIVKAVVVPRSGVTWNEERLRDHCREHLSSTNAPRSLKSVTVTCLEISWARSSAVTYASRWPAQKLPRSRSPTDGSHETNCRCLRRANTVFQSVYRS